MNLLFLVLIPTHKVNNTIVLNILFNYSGKNYLIYYLSKNPLEIGIFNLIM